MSVKEFIFDWSYLAKRGLRPDRWLVIAAVCTALYTIFALVLIGVPGLSRGGIVAALLSVTWVVYGVLFKHRHFPVVLWIPVAFFTVILTFGFQVSYYPIEPVGKLVTAWFGSIAIATFVANGLSVRYIVACFAFVVICNILAYALGYDGYSMRLKAADDVRQYMEVKRVSALAGQSNLLVAFVYTFPFSLFLLRKNVGAYALAGCLAICIAFVFLTGSRSTIPYTFLFLVFGCIYFIRTPLLRFAVGMSGTLVLLILSYIIATFPIKDMLATSALAKIEIFRRIIEVLDKQSGSVDIRIELATNFLPYFYERPIMGYGPDQFKIEVGGGSYAHNNTVELLINYGFVGTLIFYSMYLVILFNIIERPRPNLILTAPLLYLAATDFIFITHVERPLVLLLCLLLVISTTSYSRN